MLLLLTLLLLSLLLLSLLLLLLLLRKRPRRGRRGGGRAPPRHEQRRGAPAAASKQERRLARRRDGGGGGRGRRGRRSDVYRLPVRHGGDPEGVQVRVAARPARGRGGDAGDGGRRRRRRGRRGGPQPHASAAVRRELLLPLPSFSSASSLALPRRGNRGGPLRGHEDVLQCDLGLVVEAVCLFGFFLVFRKRGEKRGGEKDRFRRAEKKKKKKKKKKKNYVSVSLSLTRAGCRTSTERGPARGPSESGRGARGRSRRCCCRY